MASVSHNLPASSAQPITVIEPTKGWLSLNLREVWRYRELLQLLVWRNTVVRYKQSVVGIGWALICQEELPLAVTYFSELLTFHPEKQKVSEIIGTIGRLYSTMGDPSGAIPFFEKAKALIGEEIALLESATESPAQLKVVLEDLQNIHYHSRIVDQYLGRRESVRQESYFPKNRMFPYIYRSYLRERRLMELLELDFEMREV